jgi:7,8-dihydropterin-6-yl-methyl-4-(beta-D-ribofuranosyl)aminobenzene 5'-phosphate synthase
VQDAVCSIKIVVNNEAKLGLLPEHGFAAWVECSGQRILFDSGQSNILFHNLQSLELHCKNLDHIIYSHGHYDHTGSAATLLERNEHCQVHIHPELFSTRWSLQADGSMKELGVIKASTEALLALDSTRLRKSIVPVRLNDFMGITGEVPRKNTYEDVGGQFYLDLNQSCRDALRDDQALWIQTKNGLVILTGCGHSGIINIIQYVQSITDEQRVLAVLGGFHLLNAMPERLEFTQSALQSIAPQQLVLMHCTGSAAMAYLQKKVPGVALGHAGDCFEWEL